MFGRILPSTSQKAPTTCELVIPTGVGGFAMALPRNWPYMRERGYSLYGTALRIVEKRRPQASDRER